MFNYDEIFIIYWCIGILFIGVTCVIKKEKFYDSEFGDSAIAFIFLVYIIGGLIFPAVIYFWLNDKYYIADKLRDILKKELF